jgi:hypothetical protein
MTERLNRIDLDGGDPITAIARAEYVAGRLARGTAGDGPAFEVHVHGNPEQIMRYPEVREVFEQVAERGRDAGVVLFFHGFIDQVSEALSMHSRVLVAAIAAGGAVRHVAPGVTDPSRWSVLPAGETEGDLYSASLSAEVWAALFAQDAERLTAVFGALTAAGTRAGSQTSRRLLSDALRRAADCVLPGAGGMHGGLTFCPLCLGSPVVPVDEVPSHLLMKHAAAATPTAAERAPL